MFELVGEVEFFAPMSSDLVDFLISEFNSSKNKLTELSTIISDNHSTVIKYFVDGNVKEDAHRVDIQNLFELKPAIKSLETEYWNKALRLTDVLDYMPQKRRDDWNISMSAWKQHGYQEGKNPEKDLPPFEENIVRDTLQNLLMMRTQFFSERVDGIFRSLSGSHVTNQPEGFSKRMIINHALDAYSYPNYKIAGVINDLRSVVAKFMGRDDLKFDASTSLLYTLKRMYGEWVPLDGNSLKIKLFKKGTVHLEVHPDMAWRLNSILANLYPMAIPSQFRVKPERKQKSYELIQKPLPFAVLEMLPTSPHKELDSNSKSIIVPNTLVISSYGRDKQLVAEVESVLESIGGVKQTKGYFLFDYEPSSIISEIKLMGCIPNFKSFQYYPTPTELADKVIELADIQETHSVLEPSAGQGNLVDTIEDKSRITCIEVSLLHSKILEEKGFNVINEDFLEHSKIDIKVYDRIIMNPPFSEGRWQSHLLAAYNKLNRNGKLVAILPESAKNQKVIPNCNYYGPYSGFFKNANVSVIILETTK
jgi:hypothetical protein